MRRIDLTGKTFGKLTALGISGKQGKRGERYYICKCSCGQIKDVLGQSIASGKQKTCGCSFADRGRQKIRNIKGNRYGLWTVLTEAGRTPTKQVKWLCECDCGTQRVVNGADLVSGRSSGCGCARPHPFGESSTGWKGGVTHINTLIRNYIIKATNWGNNVLRKDDYTCQRCGTRGGYLHAHHIVKFSDIVAQHRVRTPEESYECSMLTDVGNGACLCRECHKWVHSFKNTNNDFLNTVAVIP